jgi:bifunctional DNA-binding transcriptional regulator/antitoxin component of YhaV-PrlF toxin-antitoxin module
MSNTINIRPRRQVTIPKELLEKLSLSIGDQLKLEVRKGVLIGRPIKDYTKNTIKTIQNILQDADISEEDLQQGGEKIRRELVDEKYSE